MKKIILMTMISLMICCSTAIGSDIEKKKKASGLSAAETWLSIVDKADYEKSWKEAADLFQNAVTTDQWVQALSDARIPLGKLISRKVTTSQYATSLPGAPNGEYVIIEFETKYENKNVSIETVTSILGKDGVWRVAGYYIE
jgi:Protein of unknown function (DUF4019)